MVAILEGALVQLLLLNNDRTFSASRKNNQMVWPKIPNMYLKLTSLSDIALNFSGSISHLQVAHLYLVQEQVFDSNSTTGFIRECLGG